MPRSDARRTSPDTASEAKVREFCRLHKRKLSGGRVLVPRPAKLQCRTQWRDRKVLIACTSPLIWYEIRGGPERSFGFNVGRPPDGYTAFTETVRSNPDVSVARDRPPVLTSAEARAWLLGPAGAAAVEAVQLRDGERVTVFSDALVAEMSVERDVAATLDALISLASVVPEPIQTAIEGADEVPEHLRELLRFAGLAPGDDASREGVAGDSIRASFLRTTVSPHMADINAFLNSFRGRPWTEAAARLAALAEATTELSAPGGELPAD